MSSNLYTDWAISAKGNHWKRINGKVATAGRKSNGQYWAMADGIFAEGNFTLSQRLRLQPKPNFNA